MSTTCFVTGATGLVGGALVDALVARGDRVLALVRDGRDAVRLAQGGADAVIGDLGEERGTWRARAHEADVVFHAGLPRHPFPLRGWRVGRLRVRAGRDADVLGRSLREDTPVVVASSHLVYGDRGDAPVRDADAVAPVGMGHAALAAERALADPLERVVRLGWVYGASGIAPGMVRGVVQRRLRIVGDGGNAFPLVSAPDAARALLAAAGLPPGVYSAAEADVPTQRELVETLCAQLGARRTDVLPPRMAALSMGEGMADEVRCSCRLVTGRLADAGWVPADAWRDDLVPRAAAALTPGGGPPEGARR